MKKLVIVVVLVLAGVVVFGSRADTTEEVSAA